MALFNSIAEKIRLPGGLGNALRSSYRTVAAFFDAGDPRKQMQKSVMGVVKYLLSENNIIPECKIVLLRDMIGEFAPEDSISLMAEIKDLPVIEPEKAIGVFESIPRDEKEKIIGFFLLFTVADETAAAKRDTLRVLAEGIGFSAAEFETMAKDAADIQQSRKRLWRSGTGVLVALGVILVFILTATLLRSVVFGLIGAYILLPLEKFFEKRIREKRGLAWWILRSVEIIFYPLNRLSAVVMKKFHRQEVLSESEQAVKDERRVIVKAVVMTFAVFMIAAVSFITFVSTATGHYVSTIKEKVVAETVYKPSNADRPASANQGETLSAKAKRKVMPIIRFFKPEKAGVAEEPSVLDPVITFLDRLSERFCNIPLVKIWVDKLKVFLSGDDAAEKIFDMLMRHSGGVWNFTSGVISAVTGFFVDLLLSLFFGLLFLIKLAEFCRRDKSTGRQSEYLVRTVFNGNWLPGADDSVVSEANRIISGTFARLKIWVRGYATIVFIDIIVYTIGFWLLGIPYFPVLGVIAGCGVLLPYIGPISTMILTSTVTIVAGNGGGVQLLGVLIFYFIYSSIIEQFITYPAIIGDSLGLSALETIIVVLLGAVFAGIPGMIFALPAASVAKYLIPQIYRCLENNQFWGSRSASKETNV